MRIVSFRAVSGLSGQQENAKLPYHFSLILADPFEQTACIITQY